MAQHFLLSRAARSRSLPVVLKYSDAEALREFALIRWGSDTEQTCPHCAVCDSHRYVHLQRRWRCRHCYKGFSVTSGTVLNSQKLPLQKVLGGMLIFANAVKGISALQLSRDLDVQYKTAFVQLHKLRETLFKTRDTDKLKGRVEIDGGYMQTYIRPKNRTSERPDLRLIKNQNPNKCLILVLDFVHFAKMSLKIKDLRASVRLRNH